VAKWELFIITQIPENNPRLIHFSYTVCNVHKLTVPTNFLTTMFSL